MKFQNNTLFEKVKKYIESGNIHFLIGSGASIKAIRTLGNLENDLTMFIRDFQISKENSVRDSIISMINVFLNDVKMPNNQLIESIINNNHVMTEGVKETLESYMKFLKVIYQLMLTRGSDRLPKKMNVFTTNYDLFLEFALENLRIPYNDGGIGVFYRYFSSKNFQKRIFKLSESYSYQYEEPLINIIKLHGSVNWNFDSETDSIRIANNVAIPEVTDEFLDEYAYFRQDVNLPIILPTKQKFVRTLMEHTYYDLSRLYSNELEREQSVLFTFGFSFEDEHIRSITQRALSNPYLTLLIFPYSFEDEQRLLRYFNLFTNVKVVRIQEITNEEDDGNKEYSLIFANNEMDRTRRVNIDFQVFIDTFSFLLNMVSERKVF
ncbi:SIR2 family protein [Paenibacillus qinlingensis]|uniref:SIR2 family protein n=1 Tax=Paenibacillus qinlingensis TaxID=1837343 RepID=UPI0015676919|nr:SIR2 family protein [Paenibacillus qinlingensis]NQX58550.1 SIR2 family protein [Paenibacillus qinlingensis]